MGLVIPSSKNVNIFLKNKHWMAISRIGRLVLELVLSPIMCLNIIGKQISKILFLISYSAISSEDIDRIPTKSATHLFSGLWSKLYFRWLILGLCLWRLVWSSYPCICVYLVDVWVSKSDVLIVQSAKNKNSLSWNCTSYMECSFMWDVTLQV